MQMDKRHLIWLKNSFTNAAQGYYADAPNMLVHILYVKQCLDVSLQWFFMLTMSLCVHTFVCTFPREFIAGFTYCLP